MRKRIPILLALAAVLFALQACDTSRKQIVGKWKAEGSNEVVWEFFGNGSLSTGGSPGRYSFGDGQRVKIQTQSATFVYQLEFQDDRMIWKDPNESKMEFRRMK